MDTLISMLPLLVPLLFFLYYALHPVHCPDCGETLPLLYSPFKKTRRMWLAGGYLCARCGCETNMAGRKVTADTPPAPFPFLQCALLAVLLLIGVGLGGLIVVAGRAPAPAVVAAPQLVPARPLVPGKALPPQVPAAAPAN